MKGWGSARMLKGTRPILYATCRIVYESFQHMQGGPYMEKMHRDHTEMLYWLQQERRHDVLHIATQQLAVQ